MSKPPWTPDEWVRVILAVAAGVVLIGLIIDSFLGIRIEDDTAVTAVAAILGALIAGLLGTGKRGGDK